jgi:hypothetical protein
MGLGLERHCANAEAAHGQVLFVLPTAVPKGSLGPRLARVVAEGRLGSRGVPAGATG